MSFQLVPSIFRTPEIPNFYLPTTVWRGKGADDGLFSFYASGWGGYIMVRAGEYAPTIKIGSSTLYPVYSCVNGYIYWRGNGYIYNSRNYGWIWAFEFPGYEPLENHHFEDGNRTWTGDRFYSLSSPPTSADDEVILTPRGSLYENGDERTATPYWPRWVAKSGEFGIYEGVDGASGERVKGIPRFRGNNWEYFERSFKKENGYFTYGRIHHKEEKWVLGEIGSDSGWYEGEEPKVGGSVTFRFCKNEDSEVEGDDITVSFVSYVAGDETETAYLGSVAIWR